MSDDLATDAEIRRYVTASNAVQSALTAAILELEYRYDAEAPPPPLAVLRDHLRHLKMERTREKTRCTNFLSYRLALVPPTAAQVRGIVQAAARLTGMAADNRAATVLMHTATQLLTRMREAIQA